MKNFFIYSIICSLFLISCKKEKDVTAITNPGDEEPCVQSMGVNNGDVIEGQYIVVYNPATVSRSEMAANRIEQKSESVLEKNKIPRSRIEKTFGGDRGGFVAKLSAEEATTLQKDISIAAIEPDRVIKLSTCFTVASPRLLTWNIQRVGYGNGIGKTAWVIDTGIDFEHPDLTVDTTRSRSFLSGVPSARDENGHGTHVAGIIGGKNNSFGVLGVASGATLISVRVLGKDGEGTLSSVIQALSYINANAKAGDVVNMSLGEDVSSPILIQAVQNTAAKGIYISIAAGNESTDANKYSPGNTNGTNIYTVSAIDSLDKFAGFSNYRNDVVDFAAPGVRILSTYTQNRYAYLSGTSMAAPHLAGLLLLKGRNITSSGTALNDPDGVPDPIAHF